MVRFNLEPRLDTKRFADNLSRSAKPEFFRANAQPIKFMKRQYQPSKIRRKRQHGFLNRNSSKSGKATLANRRRNGRKRLTPVWFRVPAPAETPKRLGRSVRIEQSGEFARIRQQGQRLALGCLIANWQRLPDGSKPKLGVVTSKKIGGAVQRNRARRLLRESFRQHQHELAQPVEIILVARNSIAGKKFADVERDFLAALNRAKLLKN
jgi:ribonuclease P protein component